MAGWGGMILNDTYVILSYRHLSVFILPESLVLLVCHIA